MPHTFYHIGEVKAKGSRRPTRDKPQLRHDTGRGRPVTTKEALWHSGKRKKSGLPPRSAAGKEMGWALPTKGEALWSTGKLGARPEVSGRSKKHLQDVQSYQKSKHPQTPKKQPGARARLISPSGTGKSQTAPAGPSYPKGVPGVTAGDVFRSAARARTISTAKKAAKTKAEARAKRVAGMKRGGGAGDVLREAARKRSAAAKRRKTTKRTR